MSIEQQLYETILLLAGALNVALAIMLVHNNYAFRNNFIYRRARLFTALSFCAFGIGFLMHYFLQWRTSWPVAASALSVTYFHFGGVMFCWSHTSLLNFNYITRYVAIRDISILTLNVILTWMAVVYNIPIYSLTTAFLVFFCHAAFLALTLYRTYYSARESILQLQSDTNQKAIAQAHKTFKLSCHLIVLFGIGSVLFTFIFGHSVWPFSFLLCAGAAVFFYIFYSLSEYASIVKVAEQTMQKAKIKSALHPIANIAIGILLCTAYPFTLHKAEDIPNPHPTTINQQNPRTHKHSQIDELMAQHEREQIEQKHTQMRLELLIAAMLVVFLSLYVLISRNSANRLRAANNMLADSNMRLSIANEQAQEASRMKTNFIKQISHEIRTPLNILSGFTQVLTETDVELSAEERVQLNKEIIENTQRITNLVNKMLELSEVNSRAVIEKNDTASPLMIALEAVNASGIEKAKHLTFNVQPSDEAKTATLRTNTTAAVRIISLLLDNAIKFTKTATSDTSPATDAHKQSVVMRIEQTSPDCQAQQMLQFIVEDTGIGVPANEAEHIFNEFVQLNDYYEGTGIGLTVARNLARRLDGDITLDTTYTRGARFIFTLPA